MSPHYVSTWLIGARWLVKGPSSCRMHGLVPYQF